MLYTVIDGFQLCSHSRCYFSGRGHSPRLGPSARERSQSRRGEGNKAMLRRRLWRRTAPAALAGDAFGLLSSGFRRSIGRLGRIFGKEGKARHHRNSKPADGNGGVLACRRRKSGSDRDSAAGGGRKDLCGCYGTRSSKRLAKLLAAYG